MGNQALPQVYEGQAIRFEQSPDCDVLLIAFSGMGAHDFNFKYVARRLPINKLFLRDVYQCWYQRGILEVSENIDETADYIAQLIGEHSFRRVVLTGVSGGGYAALLFGWLLDVDVVHAVAPRSYLDLRNRIENLDFRLAKFIKRLYAATQPQKEYFDLRTVFASMGEATTDFHIYYSEASRLDVLHAKHLEGLPGVTLHPFKDGGHALGLNLARQGTLETTLARSLGVEALTDPAA